MKDYVLSEECRRKILHQLFHSPTDTQMSCEVIHSCCDNCANKCDCNNDDCKSSLRLPTVSKHKNLPLVEKRFVTNMQRKLLQEKLQEIRKSLVLQAMQGDQKERKATVISCPSFFLNFLMFKLNKS
jgi:hypothetical protein